MTEIPRSVLVTFRKQISDGNYGSETAEITLEAWVESDEDEEQAALGQLMAARRYVQAELARSPSAHIRDGAA